MTKSTKIFFDEPGLTEEQVKVRVDQLVTASGITVAVAGETNLTSSGIIGFQEVSNKLAGVMTPGIITNLDGELVYAYNLVFGDDITSSGINMLAEVHNRSR